MHLIDDEAEFSRALGELADAPVYYIDTEFESTRKKTTLSVLQVSCGKEIFLLDALKLDQLARLGDVILRDDVTWVLHAGLQDVELLLESFRKPKPPLLFDTQIAWAMLGPEANVGLAYIQYRIIGIRTMKTHQADDWMRRPLPKSQLEYAASDIRHLPEIYSHLKQALEEVGRAQAVSQACHELLWPAPELPGDLNMASFRHAWQLAPKNQAVLRFLIEWYNGLPSWERERMPQSKALLSIASRCPQSARDLMRIKGIPPQLGSGHAETLVRGVSSTLQQTSVDSFEHIEPVPYATFEDIKLDGWLGSFRAEVSAAANIAPELAFPPRLLKSMRQQIVEHGERRALLKSLEGWRKPILLTAAEAFIAEHS